MLEESCDLSAATGGWQVDCSCCCLLIIPPSLTWCVFTFMKETFISLKVKKAAIIQRVPMFVLVPVMDLMSHSVTEMSRVQGL